MTNFIVFNPGTGQIKRTGSCLEDIIYLQCMDGECVIKGDADLNLHMIDMETLERIDKPDSVLQEEKTFIEALFKKDEDEAIISTKAQEILRRMAIEELKKEGKINGI